MTMTESDIDELRKAKAMLENPGLAAKISSFIGTPVEKGFERLPANWKESIGEVTKDSLMYALRGALLTMNDAPSTESYSKLHAAATTVSGIASGAFGLPGLAVDLPLSTMVMLRSIADIARANGETLSDAETQVACLEVFAMGGPSKSDDAAESGYFAVRTALANAVTEAAKFLAQKTISDEGAPALVRLIAIIASSFSVQVSQKAASMAVPVIGAVTGGAINWLFIDHFQNMSRGHFTVRRLERKYGAKCVRLEYETIILPSAKAKALPA